MRVLVTGASRGIGAAVARRVALQYPGKARIGLLARSMRHPSHAGLEGTLEGVAQELRSLGAKEVHVERADLKDADETSRATQRLVEALGGKLDLLVNNASALDLHRRPTPKQAGLVLDVNVKGTLAVSLACADALRGGAMVTLSPPLSERYDWIADHPHYTVSKYAMTTMTLGFSADGVRANTLWPRHTVATAATERLEAVVEGAHSKGRHPDDVALAVLSLAASKRTGEMLFDDEVAPLAPTEAPLDLFVE